MKDIKVKETKRDIHTLNKQDVFEYHAKQKDVKKKLDQNQQDTVDHSDPTKKATATVVGREKKTAVESAYMAKQYAKKIRDKKARIKEQLVIDTESPKKEANIKEKNVDIKEKTSDDSNHIRIKDKESSSNHAERLKTGETKSKIIKSTDKKSVKIKTKETGSKKVAFRSVNKNDYQKQMKFFHMKKHKMKVKEAQGSSRMKKGIHQISNGIKNTFKVVKVAATSIQ